VTARRNIPTPGAAAASPLRSLVRDTLARTQPPAVHAAAAHVAARFGETVAGVLFHGSALRAGDLTERILDFYVLVDDYTEAFRSRPLALATRLLPPSVFYDEAEWEGAILRSKVNVISLADFRRMAGGGGPGVTVWARFAQPAALVSWRDRSSRAAVEEAIADAVRTMLAEALPRCESGTDARRVWTTALRLTYSAELRAEPPGKAEELVDTDADYYERAFAAAMQEFAIPRGHGADGEPLRPDAAPDPALRRRSGRRWRRRRLTGKALSIARLVKSAFTFDGGIDYLAWKIERHSGVKITPNAWQRRHPILGGVWLYLRFRRRGAFR